MPAALSTAEPVKTWWSLSKSPSSKDLRQKFGQESESPQVKVSKFNSFASAIGFKSKKPPTPSLAIQDPPSYVENPPSLPSPNPVSPISSRPSKATSSTRSRVDSLEPRTPNEFSRDRRQSLLTLSDTDPFAGRPMIVPSLPSDPNRLSAYSNSSANDLGHKKGETQPFNRVSYASSSSNSNHHNPDFPPAPVMALDKASETRQLHNKRSISRLQIKRPDPLLRQASMTTPHTTSLISTGSSSASVLATASHATQPDSGPVRPKMRARGMTDSGTSTRAGFFVEQLPSRKQPQKASSPVVLPTRQEISNLPEHSTSPRVVVRQASSSRLQTPPSAPPTHCLPTPPKMQSQKSKRPQTDSQAKSASSSGISFSSAISLTNDMFANPALEKRASGRSNFSHVIHDEADSGIDTEKGSKTTPSSPRPLKKVLSQQSLSRRNQAAPPPASTTSSEPLEKAFRKQRSFHHPRLPIPTIPLPARASTSSGSSIFPSATTDSAHSPSTDQRRGSITSSLGRKRLFSNNSTHNRPSTAQPTSTIEDDKLSLFSLRSDNDFHVPPYKPWSTSASHQSPFPSLWDDGASDILPKSPVRSIPDYTPQAIMSKAELAKLDSEAPLDSSPYIPSRSRGFSILSASTMASSHLSRDQDSEVAPIGLSPPPSNSRQSGRQLPMRTSSNSYRGTPSDSKLLGPQSSANPAFPRRNNHDDSNAMQPISSPISQETLRPSSPASAAVSSLPPPPRRHRPAALQHADRPSSSHATSLRKANSIRSVSTIEKAIHRRSIMKKPSFLEFGADTDEEADEEDFDPRTTGSFLDLARESFETVRSDD